MKFQVNLLLVQDKKVQNRFSTWLLVNWLFGSGGEAKNRFNGFPIGTISATFDLQVTLMLPTKSQVNCPVGSGEEAKNRFARCGHLSYKSS